LNNQKRLEEVVRRIVKWYQENKRDLPWRKDKNPYQIWISEIMLQQTRIEAVKGYYDRFLKEVPSIEVLAKISEEKLLKLWEGLGYYNRAKNLQKAAKIMMEEYNGKMPKSFQELVVLPGIGEYTAGAIASIAYNEKIPAVDGNVLRVITRIIESREDILNPKTKKEITLLLQTLIPKEAGDFNQGIMELGEVICLPNGEPLCEKCPLKDLCITCEKNLTEEIPVRIVKTKKKKVEVTVFLLRYDEEIAIQKREKKGLLANLYELPNEEKLLKKEEIEKWIKDAGLEKQVIKKLYTRKHIFSHIEWRMICYRIRVSSLENPKDKSLIFVDRKQSEEQYAIPSAFGTYVKYMMEEIK